MRHLVFLLFLAACKREDVPVAADAAHPPPESSAVASEAPIVDTGVPKPDMTLETRRVATRWDAAYNARDASAIANNYTAEVLWNGKTVTRDALKDGVAGKFAKAPTLTQSSVVDSVTEVPDGVRAAITTTVGSTKHTYYWHLVKSQSGGLRIDQELRANM